MDSWSQLLEPQNIAAFIIIGIPLLIGSITMSIIFGILSWGFIKASWKEIQN